MRNQCTDRRRIAVIGAGVLGVALAHQLAQEGARVTLLDRETPGQGASLWSLAWLNSNGKAPRAYHDLNVHGMQAWARLAERIGGADWYRPVGNLSWADGATARRALADRVRRLRSWGYAAHLIGPERAAELEPALALPEGIAQVAWFPGEGYVRTGPLIAALVRRALECGAEVRTGAAGRVVAAGPEDPAKAHGAQGAQRAQGVQGTGTQGRVAYMLRTADGGLVRADALVSCAGRWTPEVTRLLAGSGAAVPVVDPAAAGSSAPGFVALAGPVAQQPHRLLHTPLVHLRAAGDGQVHLEAEDAEAAVDLHTPRADLDAWAGTLLDRARRIVPGLAGARVTGHKVCVRPLPLDGLPVVGEVTGGVTGEGGGPYVVVTHSGVTLAAWLAELVARELLEGVRLPELAPYRPLRFARPGTP